MKQICKIILFALLMSIAGAKVFAYDFAIDNSDGITIYYNYINDGKDLEVTSKDFHGDYSGVVVIPEEVTYMNRTRKVTSIGVRAFMECFDLTSIKIPQSVTSIGNDAFFKCNNLTDVKVSVLDFSSFCNNTIVGVINHSVTLVDNEGKEIKEYVVPDGVTSIGDYAFAGCSGLTSITIPNSVTSIGKSAFWFCSGLTSITIPNSVTSIEINTFFECLGLTSVTIGNSVTSIGKYAFGGCKNLTSLTILSGVTSIGESAFQKCSGLTSVTLPNSVTNIENHAFRDCLGLTSVTIPNSVTSIGESAFRDCLGLTSVTIGNSVTSIGKYAFDGADIPIVVSLVENPFEIYGKTSDNRIFTNNTFLNATLYVPVGTIEKYKATEGWKDFMFIEEGIPAKYTLTYMVDGEVYKTYELTEGDAITPETEPTKDGYDFSGWSDIPETMPANDVTITGTFTLSQEETEETTDDAIKITSAGQTTWCSAYDLDFTGVEGLKAYIAPGYNRTTGTIWLMRVYEVPAGEGILLIGDPGDYQIPHKSTTTYYMNMLVGTLKDITINETDGEYTNYYLSKGTYGVGFYKVSGSVDIKANRAYLPLLKNTVSGSRGFIGMDFDDDEDGTTGISEAQQMVGEPDVYYNLQGQRVDNPTKGLYIRNGKKVVIK